MPVRNSAAAAGFGTAHWPVEIRLEKAERRLEIDFDDGSRFVYPAEFLRVESPSAEVQGHGPGQKQLVAGRREVGILDLEPVGNYAVRIRFDDLHDTGIFSWAYLYEIGRDRERLWKNYLAALEAAGKSREPGT
ncbi:gamma-butyrobetaine hydroxylase-like domain-containing protein [Stella sp.]|uniref:gamma-butyrobetaine hydroxylase-like domain-containing protein n=1 Tax=Stella sp. TaxID=2912054 RepID=UPI0035B2B539